MIKYKNDTRYDDKMIVTHDNIKVDAVICYKLEEIDQLFIVDKYDVICVDEVQFYPDAPTYLDKWANMGKIVEACGLSGTYDRTPFPIISQLVPISEDITFLTAICRETGNNAVYSNLVKGNKNEDATEELIGGAEAYSAVDRYTYFCNKSVSRT
jgi:thymidine kinase